MKKSPLLIFLSSPLTWSSLDPTLLALTRHQQQMAFPPQSHTQACQRDTSRATTLGRGPS